MTFLVACGHGGAGCGGLGVYVGVIRDSFLNWEPQEAIGSSLGLAKT